MAQAKRLILGVIMPLALTLITTPSAQAAPAKVNVEKKARKEVLNQADNTQETGVESRNFSDVILTRASSYRGTPYRRGGSLDTGKATDCSGFVQHLYKGLKIDLPRSSAEQARVGKVVTRTMDFSKMLPGDLLFFRRGGRGVGHVGIYLGENQMIHASNHRRGVTLTDLTQSYYTGTFVVAKRVFEVKNQQ